MLSTATMLFSASASLIATPMRPSLFSRASPVVMDDAFGASHTSVYTDAVKKDNYETLEEVLGKKLKDKALVSVVNTMMDACGTITEALRTELVTVAEEQASVFGDVQLGVDVLADNLIWDICKTE